MSLERYSLSIVQYLLIPSPCSHYPILLTSLYFLLPKKFINLFVKWLSPVPIRLTKRVTCLPIFSISFAFGIVFGT